MEVFNAYLAKMDDAHHRARMEEVLGWVMKTFPTLSPKVAWNQPMFTEHGTYIIGFSAAKNHFAVGPEAAGIDRFSDAIQKAGYSHTKGLFRIPWDSPVDYALLKEMIEFNRLDKAESTTFWRK